jgi:hypothetical protein
MAADRGRPGHSFKSNRLAHHGRPVQVVNRATTHSRQYAEGITMDIVVSKSRLRPVLFGILAMVVTTSVAVEALRPILRLGRRSGILPLLSMSHEGNVPTIYTAALLFVDALLAALCAAGARERGERFVAHWWALAAGFCYIALDEILVLHEAWGALVPLATGGSVHPSGVLHFLWVIPAAIVVLVVGLVFLPFLRGMPPVTRRAFVLAGAVYVVGAVGMELPLGWWTEQRGSFNLGYVLIDALEESLEMLGLNLFLLGAVDHLAGAGYGLRFSRGPAGAASSGGPSA